MTRNQALELIKPTIRHQPTTLEVGFFRGEFSSEIVKVLDSKKHYVIDTFSDANMVSGDKDGNNLSYQDMTAMEEYSQSLGYVTVKGTSDKLSSIVEYFDFVYIDGDHSYEWVSKDLVNAVCSTRPGAILAGHDYSQDKFPGCYRAVNDFCNKYNLSIFLITDDGCPSYFIRVP